jgi:NitT/TauT family transport system ATP-binding protein
VSLHPGSATESGQEGKTVNSRSTDVGPRGSWSIELKDVGKTFPATRRGGTPLRVLSDISMSITGGEVTGLIGPSGCGKSTLLMLAAGLESPTVGEVLLDGQPVNGTYDDLGIAFQRDLLMPSRNVLNNVLLPLVLRSQVGDDGKERAGRLLDVVGLRDFERYYPRQLSGGMKQRVALCRALVNTPAVLMLDEPFAAVDAFTREELAVQLEALLAATRQATTLLITHSIDEAVFMCDQVYVLSAKPARVSGHVTIDLPRPRVPEMRRDARFHAYTDEIRQIVDSGRTS